MAVCAFVGSYVYEKFTLMHTMEHVIVSKSRGCTGRSD
jgi:hypothetical protein